jgi:hypothetical protein
MITLGDTTLLCMAMVAEQEHLYEARMARVTSLQVDGEWTHINELLTRSIEQVAEFRIGRYLFHLTTLAPANNSPHNPPPCSA